MLQSLLLRKGIRRPAKRHDRRATPDGRRIYAIGDLHGCAGQLDRMLRLIFQDMRSHAGRPILVFMGDYVDRGPGSRQVVDLLLGLPGELEIFCLQGNHDRMLLDFLSDASVYRDWRNFGAAATLASYGVTPPSFSHDAALIQAQRDLARNMPPAHHGFFNRLIAHVELGDYLFVHAGIRPGLSLGEQDPGDLLGIREEFLESEMDFGRIVVHGHTPSEDPIRRPNRIGIDTGAYATSRLTAAVLEGTDVRFLHT